MIRLLACAALAACSGGLHHELYSGPVNVPTRIDPVTLDAFYSQYVLVFDGGRTPVGASNVTARCADASICEATVVPLADNNQRWPELRVVGKQLGTTTVIVDLVHPTHHTPEQHVLVIEFVSARSRPAAMLGQPLPAGEIEYQPPGADAVRRTGVAACRATAPASALVTAGAGHKSATYECRTSVVVAADGGRFRTCNGICPDRDEQRFTLCAVLAADGAVGSTTHLLQKHDFTHDVLAHHGDATACRSVK